MKTLLTAGVVFAPGARTLDFSRVAGFELARLYGVVNATAGAMLYAPGLTGFGSRGFAAGVLTLQADTAGMADGDTLLVVYDSPAAQPVSVAALPLPAGAARDGTDPDAPVVANAGTGLRGWLATIAGLLRRGPSAKADAASVTIATDQGNLEPGGAAIAAAAMPAGGVGLTGWLSAIWSALTGANQRSLYTLAFDGFGTAANGAAVPGRALDAGASPSAWVRVRAMVGASAAGGTFTLQASADGFGASFVTVAIHTVATASGAFSGAGAVVAYLEAPVQFRYVRLVYTPGANAAVIEGTLSLHTA